MKKLNKSIVIIGRISSGKTTLAEAISRELDVPIASFGKYLVHYSSLKGIKIMDRSTLQDLGNKLIQKNSNKFLRDVIEFTTNKPKSMIFEGVRHKIIFSEIKENSHSTFSIFLDIDQKERYTRMVKRGKDSDRVKNFEDFEKMDNHIVEMEIDELKPFTDIILGHRYSLDDILKAVKAAIKV